MSKEVFDRIQLWAVLSIEDEMDLELPARFDYSRVVVETHIVEEEDDLFVASSRILA